MIGLVTGLVRTGRTGFISFKLTPEFDERAGDLVRFNDCDVTLNIFLKLSCCSLHFVWAFSSVRNNVLNLKSGSHASRLLKILHINGVY